MTVLETLKSARDLISKRSRWCQGNSAVNREGQPTQYWLNDACKFCAWAAVLRCGGQMVNEDTIALLEKHTGGVSLMKFNDKNDHATVLRLFDEAIGEAQGLKLLT